MKNQRGVTLIALVVTIIVLIILAGVAIAALTGQNGLITRSRESKVYQIRGEVNDRIVLALASAKVAAENEATKNGSWFAAAHMNDTIKEVIEADLNTDTRGTYTYSIANSTSTTGTPTTTGTIIYDSADYDQAMNNSSATIKYDITVTGNNFSYEVTYLPEDITK